MEDTERHLHLVLTRRFEALDKSSKCGSSYPCTYFLPIAVVTNPLENVLQDQVHQCEHEMAIKKIKKLHYVFDC